MEFQLDGNTNFTTMLQQDSQVSMENGSFFDMSFDATKASIVEKHGNNMKGDRFWKRIEIYYTQWKDADWSARTRSSLNHRWGTIQHDVNKFCGFLTQVEAQHRSGVSNEDNIQEARRMYLEIMKSPFRFDHCWVLLKDQEKWKKRNQCSGVKRKKFPAPSNNSPPQETINLSEDFDEQNKENYNKRPGGRKAAKEKKKLLGDVSGFTNILLELKDEKQKSRVEKIEKVNLSIEQKSEFLQLQKSQLLEAREANRIQIEKLQMQSRIENEKLQLERDREDMNIMMKDLTSLNAEQKNYFEMRRMEIMIRKNSNI
ncbi:hypothetical protein OROMI_026594 [Orobanche minor]